MTRRIPLEGVDNFRDFGDYAVAGGRRLKRGRLFRSASHGRASDADLDVIGRLGIATVVDLRRKGERDRDPSRRHAAFAGAVIDNDLGDDREDEWLAHLRQSDLTAASFRAYLLGYYDKAAADPRHIDLFSRFFRALAASDGAVLIHCAAGKDRTGILAALTHHLAGVHRDDIVEDYLLTNDEDRFERRAPQVVDLIHGVAGRAPSLAAVRVAMSVESAFLETAFVAMTRDFGGVDAYLERRLGVDAALKASLRDRLLD
jgi:protein-tyrosine phosphatase